MKKQELNQLLQNLYADELVDLKSILDKSLNSIISAKDSNHKIIKRECKMNCCPLCSSNHFVKNGVRKDTLRQKYLCRSCKKSFSDTTNTITFHSKKSYNTWETYISCLLKGMTLSDSAGEIGISITTSFAWRHKILKTLSAFDKSSRLSETIELDAIYFPINKRN